MRTAGKDLTFMVGGHRVGFANYTYSGVPPLSQSFDYTTAYLGPLGSHSAPLPATACWVLVAFLPVVLLAMAVHRSIRRRRRLANPPPAG
jgi:hypothetical protein